MSVRLRPAAPAIPEGTYVELVRSVLSTLLPTTIMGILFTLASMHSAALTGDAALRWLGAVGVALSLARVGILLAHAGEGGAGAGRADARRTERLFAAGYLGFAATLGLYGARAFRTGDPDVGLITAALLVGYGAGVAAGVSLRPWIALPAIVLAVALSVGANLMEGDRTHLLLGFTMAAFLMGGMSSMVARFRSETEKITMRRALDDLTRHDHLTGLANRLGLADLHAAAAGGAECLTAVHCLDLDRFKEVNDRHGHPVGDALLKAVAGRLTRLLRGGDAAARLGGDEFAILQTGLAHGDEAELLARRVTRALSEPYAIGDVTLAVGVSIGFTVSADCATPLDDMVAIADGPCLRPGRRWIGLGAVATSSDRRGGFYPGRVLTRPTRVRSSGIRGRSRTS